MVSILLVEFVRGLLILHLDVVFYRRQETSESITESSYGSLRKFLSYSRRYSIRLS
jgi:hypothetical protein